MAKASISRFSVPDPDELPADLRERIQAVSEKTGFVPNVFLALARRPDEFRAFFAYYDAVMLREGGLSKAEKEMIVVATSAANQCPYCVVAHGALLRLFSKNPLLGDQVAVNYRSADLDRRQRAMLDAALKLATAPQSFGENDIQTLLACGFTKEDVWDIGAITSLFALSNRMAHLTDMRPNEEFYALGRIREACTNASRRRTGS
ncbi:MAG: alkylhydroperoxidase [Lysobacterales bacterium]|nr:MAG: alkylhydroperoxidase [Xanthomonadales bacterium]